MAASPLEKYIEMYNGKLPTENDPNYLELLRMGKYKILANPFYQPGKCANCGSAKVDGRMYVDFDLDIDWYGKVYLCTLCLMDIATAANLFEGYLKQRDELAHRVMQLTIALEEAKKIPQHDKELHEAVIKTTDELKEYYARLTGIPALSHGDAPSASDLLLERENTINKSGTDQTERSIKSTEPGTVKQTTSSRRTNVPNLTELLNRKPD